MSTYKFKAIHNGQLEGSKYWPYTVSGGSNVSLIQFVNIIHTPISLHDKLTLTTSY